MAAHPPIAHAPATVVSDDVRVSGTALWDGLLAPLNLAAFAIFTLIAVNQLGAADAPAQRLALAVTLGVFILAFWLGELLPARAQARPLESGRAASIS